MLRHRSLLNCKLCFVDKLAACNKITLIIFTQQIVLCFGMLACVRGMSFLEWYGLVNCLARSWTFPLDTV
jgi:hypothetical protein